MIGEICKYLNNYFLSHGEDDKHHDRYAIINGVLSYADGSEIDFLQTGQYFRIAGSVFNDGVYKSGAEDLATVLTDESFDGSVWAMSVPKGFAELVDEISAWMASDATKAAADSPYSSESFGGYSYSKETGSDGSFSWQNHFAGKLAMWRKARVNR